MTLSLGAEGVAVATLSVFLFLSAPATLAADNPTQRIGVLVTPARLDLAVKPGETSIKRELIILNKGVGQDTFSIEPIDLVISNGTTELLPAHSTPYAAEVSIAPQTLTLGPGKLGKVTVSFDTSRQPVFFGGLVIASTATSAPQRGAGQGVGVVVRTQIVVPFSAAPVDSSGYLLPSLRLSAKPAGLNLPLVIEGGPIIAESTLRNDGNVYARLFSRYEFSQLGRDFLTVSDVVGSAMPGGYSTTSASTRQRLERGGGLLDVAPLFCVCQVTVTTHAWLANQETTVPVTQSATVLVLPYRLLLGLLWLVVAGVLATRMRRRWWRR